jgi:hypothetical protein
MTDAVVTTSTAPNNPTPPGQVTQRQTEPTRHDGTPRPGVIADAQYDALPDDQKAGFARVRKGPDGGSEWVDRSKLSVESTGDKQPGTTPDAVTGDGKATVNADGKLQIGEMLLSEDDIKSLMTQKATADLRAMQVPAEPTGYEPKLPEGLKLPGDLEFRVDAADPALQDLRRLAKKIGLTQAEFSDVLAVYAGSEAHKEAAFRTAMAGELTKMGANATMRVTAIDVGLRGLLGDDLGRAMKSMIVSEKLARGFETLLSKFASQGAASFRQDGREPAANGNGPLSSMPEAEYNALSAAERFRISRMG